MSAARCRRTGGGGGGDDSGLIGSHRRLMEFAHSFARARRLFARRPIDISRRTLQWRSARAMT